MLLSAVIVTGSGFVTSLCTDDLPPVTATIQEFNLSTLAKSTVCQLVEKQHSFLSEPYTFCELVCLHQNLQPNKISFFQDLIGSVHLTFPCFLCFLIHILSVSISLLIPFF